MEHVFPSPHGDKFQPLREWIMWDKYECFRPLTGINFNIMSHVLAVADAGFRPLTGINFNASTVSGR